MVTRAAEHPSPLAASTRGELATQQAIPRLRAVRGAVSVDGDTPEAMDAAVHELLRQLLGRNAIDPGDVVSAIFSATPDLRSRPPAAAARTLGWTDVPMMCVAELDIDDMLERCVRVLLHVSVADGRRLTPVYLGDAASLRPDLDESSAHRERSAHAA